jgi:integrase
MAARMKTPLRASFLSL